MQLYSVLYKEIEVANSDDDDDDDDGEKEQQFCSLRRLLST